MYAGKPERKVHGLNLFRQGYAPRIVFSVARYEWRRFAELGLEEDGNLVGLVEATPPERRQFFVTVRAGEGARAELVRKGRFGTLDESVALAGLIERERLGSVLVVSSSYHLRRAVDTLERLCRARRPVLVPVATPESRDRSKVLGNESGLIAWELLKCFLYRFLPVKGNHTLPNEERR